MISGCKGNRHSKTETLVALNEMLLERAQAGRTTALIVDEAHNFEWDVLEEIRLLGNLENRRGKLLQIVIAGQQELDVKLERPEYRQLKQRISLRCLLRGFDLDETEDYISSRMARAGVCDQTIVPREIVTEIHNRSQGIPRLINSICDNLLLTAFAMESKTATLEMLDEVTTDMRIDHCEKPTIAVHSQPPAPPSLQSAMSYRPE